MKIEDIFTSFLVSDFLNLDNLELENYCLSKITKGDCTNSGSLNLHDGPIQELLTEVKKRVNIVHNHIGLSDDWTQDISRCWANLNCTNDIVAPHSHPESFFSCVYYVTGIDESYGRLEFISPVHQMLPVVKHHMIKDFNRYLAPTWWVNPEPGKLIIFPSWLWHFVNKNTSGKNRISIALDTIIKKRENNGI